MANDLIKISAVLVVYNEEAVIERALQSLVGVADETIVIHDGICKDKTIQIAKKYTDRIYILNHVGEAEPHRPFAYSIAAYDFILQLDADEYIPKKTKELIIEMKKMSFKSLSLDWYVVWENKTNLLGKKMLLFNKWEYYFIGIPHEWPKELKQEKDLNLYLETPLMNAPKYDNSSWSVFLKKWIKWKNIHAEYLNKNFEEINTWNYNQTNFDFPNRLLIKHPLVFGLPYIIIYESLRMITSLSSGPSIIKTSFFMFIYRILLILRLNELKNHIPSK